MSTITPVFTTLSEADARALVARHRLGRIAFTFHDHVDIEPVHYAVDGEWLFGRTSIGTKLATLAHHPWCAFEVDEVHGMFDWTSVVIKGSFYTLDPEASSQDLYRRALAQVTALIPDTFSAADPVPHRSILFGIYVQEISGRAAATGGE